MKIYVCKNKTNEGHVQCKKLLKLLFGKPDKTLCTCKCNFALKHNLCQVESLVKT